MLEKQNLFLTISLYINRGYSEKNIYINFFLFSYTLHYFVKEYTVTQYIIIQNNLHAYIAAIKKF